MAKSRVYVCSVKACEAGDLYPELCAAAKPQDVEISNSGCLRICKLCVRVDVYDSSGNLTRYGRERLERDGQELVRALGNDPVKTVLGY